MKDNPIYVTDLDMERLRKLLIQPELVQQRPYLETLEHELDRAQVVPAGDVPADVITMNSTARLIDLETGEEMVFTLVYPGDAAIRDGKISVLAPVGTAILGCRKGDTVEWEVPSGVRLLRVAGVLYQPEAAGDFALE